MHLRPSCLDYMLKLATLASVIMAQEGPLDFQGQGHGFKVKGHRAQIACKSHLSLMGSTHTHFA